MYLLRRLKRSDRLLLRYIRPETALEWRNEINTIPGHTSISMYPMLMERAGHPMAEYINEMIEMAYERHKYEKSKN